MAFGRRRDHTERVESDLPEGGTPPGTTAHDPAELQQLLAAAIDSTLEPLSIIKPVWNSTGSIIDFEWIYINDAGADALRLPRESVTHRLLLDVLPGHSKRLFDHYKEVAETGEPYIGHEVEYSGRWGSTRESMLVLNIRATKIADAVAVSWRDVTEHVRVRARLLLAADTVRLQQQIVDRASEGIWVIDEFNRTTYVNEAMATIVGVTTRDMIGTDLYTFVDETNHAEAAARLRSLAEGRGGDSNLRLINQRGEEVCTRLVTMPFQAEDGSYLGSFALVTDITGEVRNARQREMVESMFTQTTEQAPIGQAVVGLDGRFLTVNTAYCTMTGFTKDQLLNKTFQEITHPEDLDAELEQAIALAGGQGDSYTMDKRYIRADGRVLWVRLHCSVTRDEHDAPIHFVAQVLDIDKQRKAEESATHAIQRLAYRSTHDPLTSLPNRSKLLATLSRAMHDTPDRPVSVLFIDLDQFKHINEGLSHSSGDAVLVEAARRIRDCVREGDTVGRVGGDEFAVVAHGLVSSGDSMLLAERIRRAVADQPFDASGSRVHITVSAGVARSSGDETPQELLSRADAALHLAKARGRNCCQLADKQMLQQTRERLQLVDRLHDGIRMDEFYPWFQKIVDLESGALVGHEVLARWIRDGEVLEAEGFIDAAEDSGLINAIGSKVISDAIEIFADENPSEFLAVNASPLQLRAPGFAQSILRQLAECGIATRRLSVEITEQSLLGNEGVIIANLGEFHNQGVDLYVDDFGTGFSSVSTLRDYPIAGLKLDKSFSKLLARNPHGSIAQLVSGLSELASHLKLDRIAEGIEDPQCAQRVLELGWVRGQGFLYGHAESLSDGSLSRRGKRRSTVPDPRPQDDCTSDPDDQGVRNRRLSDLGAAHIERR